MATKNRTELKSYFVKNAVPTEANFADLIDSSLAQSDDGVFKVPDEPLAVVAAPGDQKRVLRLFGSYPASNPDWMMSLNPGPEPAQAGLGISDGTTNAIRLFVGKANGRVGIGTNAPAAMLHVQGDALVTGSITAQRTATITGTFFAGASATIVGAAALQNTLNVAGAAALQSTLNVAGATRLTNSIDVAGPARLTNSLDVQGPAVLRNQLEVLGQARVNGMLTVGAIALLQNSAQINGTLTVSGNANVLSLVGTNHAYVQFFPQTAGTRRGWIGYGGQGTVDMGIASEGGNLNLSAAGHITLNAAAGRYVQVGSGALLSQVAIGVAHHGALPYAYESIQLGASHNLRINFGTQQRMVLTTGGDATITGNIGNAGYDPRSGPHWPPGWGGGVHTFDVIAEASIGYSALRQWSSIREKTAIRPIEGALQTLENLTPSTFDKAGERRLGFIAEEVLEVFPQGAAAEDEFFANGIAPDALLALAVRAIQELSDKVHALEDAARPKKRAAKTAPEKKIEIVREAKHENERYVTAWFHAAGDRRVARTIRLAKGVQRDAALEAEYASWIGRRAGAPSVDA